MSRKTLIWIGMFIGSTVFSYIPLLWDGSFLSFSSIILGAVGSLLGIYAGYKAADFF
jgi:hypothetical protein